LARSDERAHALREMPSSTATRRLFVRQIELLEKLCVIFFYLKIEHTHISKIGFTHKIAIPMPSLVKRIEKCMKMKDYNHTKVVFVRTTAVWKLKLCHQCQDQAHILFNFIIYNIRRMNE
jgi:hypothetical protein